MKDKNLDIPGEANREKHMNFLEAEEKTSSENVSDNDRFSRTKQDEERTKEWKEAMKEAERDRDKNSE